MTSSCDSAGLAFEKVIGNYFHAPPGTTRHEMDLSGQRCHSISYIMKVIRQPLDMVSPVPGMQIPLFDHGGLFEKNQVEFICGDIPTLYVISLMISTWKHGNPPLFLLSSMMERDITSKYKIHTFESLAELKGNLRDLQNCIGKKNVMERYLKYNMVDIVVVQVVAGHLNKRTCFMRGV